MESVCLIPDAKTLAKAINELMSLSSSGFGACDTQPQPAVYRKAKNLFIMIQADVYN